jgi:hypothetical protein
MAAPRAMTAAVIGLPIKESGRGSFLAAPVRSSTKREACGTAATRTAFA